MQNRIAEERKAEKQQLWTAMAKAKSAKVKLVAQKARPSVVAPREGRPSYKPESVKDDVTSPTSDAGSGDESK